MRSSNVCIFGSAGFAKEVWAVCQRRNIFVPYFIDRNNAGNSLYSTPIISDENFNSEKYKAIVAIGDPKMRKKICGFVELKGGKFFTITDPNVILLDPGRITISEGCVICAGVVITIDVFLGKHCHINLNSTIGHDTQIGDYVTISPGVNISGNVKIGKNCYIGTNACIKERINICDNTIIGMGAVVIKNITEAGTYIGNPARRIK